MAKLYFDIGANYEDVIRLTARLRELEKQMIQTDMATDMDGLKKLQKEYSEVSNSLQLLVAQGVKSGADIKKMFDSLNAGLTQTLSDMSANLQKGADVTGKEMLEAYSAMSEEVESALLLIEQYSQGVAAALQDNSRQLSELKRLQLDTTEDIPEINEKIAKLEEEDAKYRDLQQSLDDHKKGIQDEAQRLDESIEKYDALAKKQAELIAQKEEAEANGQGISDELSSEMITVESEMQNVVGTFLSSGASMQQKISSLSGTMIRLGNQFLQNKLNATVSADGMNIFQKASQKASLALVRLGMSAKGARLAIAGLTAVLPTAAVTLLVSAIIKLIQKYKDQKAAEEELRQQQLEHFKAIANAVTDEVYGFLQLQNAWKELGDDMGKAQFLEDRKKDLEKLGLAIDNIATAEDIFINRTDDYIASQIKKAEADAYLEQVRTKISEAMQKRQERDAADRNTKFRKQTGVDANGYAVYEWTTQYDELDKEYNALQGEITDMTKKAFDASRQGQSIIDSLFPIGPTQGGPTIKEELAKRKKEYEDAQKWLDTIQEGQDKYTIKQLEDAKQRVATTKKAYEEIAGKKSEGGNTPDRRDEFEKYAEKLAEMARQAEEDITNAEIDAMRDGDEKILAQQKLRREKALHQAGEIQAEMTSTVTDPKELETLNAEYVKLVGTINRYYDILDKGENLTRSNQRAEENRQAEENYINSLLENYKSLEDEKMEMEADFLADSVMLQLKYEETGDEVYLRTLEAREKAHEEYLRKLMFSSSKLNPLIFANSESLTDTMLGDAITAVTDAINNCDPKNIEALTDLYDKLHRFQSEQNSRSDWGFTSVFKGISDLNGDELKNLENAYKTETDPDKKKQLQQQYLNDLSEAQQKVVKGFSDIGSSFGELGSMLSQFDGALGDIGATFSAIASQSDVLGKIFSGTLTKTDAISAGISGVIQLGSMVLTAIHNNKKAQEEWNKTVDECAQKYRMLALDALDYKQQNIFGVENPYKKAIDGAYQYGKAMEELQGQMADLNKGQVQTGTKKVVDWANVGKGTAIGAAAGAAVGTIIPGIGTAIGAAIGAAIGLIAGALSTKTVPVLESLSSVYGELFDPNTYKLNDKILADYDKLDEDTKRVVDNWEEIREKALEAEQQMKDTFSALSGDVGKQLSDSLVDAFRNGDLYSAIDDFHGYMTGTIEDIIEQMIFSTVFQDMFDELEKRMSESFKGPNADNDITDDLMWMENEYQNRLEVFDMYMKQAKDSLSGQGYDAWAKEIENQSATGGGFQTMSQDTGTELNGRFTALQISGENIEAGINGIAANFTLFSERFASQLVAIDDIRNIQAQSLIELQGINENTLLALKPIREMNATLGEIKTKVDTL